MPDDKFNGRYIDQALVKGNWYGISSGPKPQVFTGNIDNATGLANGLEDIRNKALLIISPNESNGHFPNGTYGHPSLITTIRYGDNFYLQRLVDTQGDSTTPIIEYIRTKYGNSSWTEWQRVTSFGDASSTASLALTTAQNAAQNITYINTAIGGISANPSIDSRVKSNASNITKQTDELRKTNTRVNDLFNGSANDSIARRFITNNDVRSGQSPGIKFYANQNGFTIGSSNSVRVLNTANMRSWGFNGNNSVFLVSNANNDLNQAHVEGGTFVPDDGSGNRGGWYAVWNSSTNTDILLNWTLIVFNQSMG